MDQPATLISFLRNNSNANSFHTNDAYIDYLYNSSPPLHVMSERAPTLSRANTNPKPRTTESVQHKPGKGTSNSNENAPVAPAPFSVQRETIIPPSTGLSGLSKMLQKSGKNSDQGLNLLVYLPDRQPLTFQISKSATVEQTIVKVLQLHKDSKEKTVQLRGTAANYELRLHEEDGMPEEDFPALERTREVKHFGGEGDHEYCLCQIEGMALVENKNGDDHDTNQQGGTTSEVQLPSGKYLKIRLPGNLHSTIKKNDTRYHTLRDLIPYLAKKQSMPNLYYETVQFEVSEENCVKLNMMSTILDLGTLLVELKVDNVELTTKTYADTPTKSGTRDSTGGTTNQRHEASSVLGRVVAQDTRQLRNMASQRPPETAFRFDALTAAIYQEWPIKKKNKWGRWQTRILGIDIQKMYNKKSGGQYRGGRERRGSTVGVKNPERLITDILELEYVEGTTTRFRLKHVEPGDTTQTLEYEAETSHDCVEIMTKLRFILKSSKF